MLRNPFGDNLSNKQWGYFETTNSSMRGFRWCIAHANSIVCMVSYHHSKFMLLLNDFDDYPFSLPPNWGKRMDFMHLFCYFLNWCCVEIWCKVQYSITLRMCLKIGLKSVKCPRLKFFKHVQVVKLSSENWMNFIILLFKLCNTVNIHLFSKHSYNNLIFVWITMQLSSFAQEYNDSFASLATISTLLNKCLNRYWH